MQQIEDLTQAVNRLSTDASALRQEMRRRTQLGVVLAVVLVAAIATITLSAVDTSRRIQQSNQRWCPMVNLLIPGRNDPPSTTLRGQQIVAQARTLSASFGCPPVT